MRLTSCLRAFAFLLFLPARADEPVTAAQPKDSTKKAPAAETARPAEPAGSSLTVARDPVTGALRPLTPDEALQLLGRRRLVAAPLRVITLPDGTKMMRLGPDQASLSLVRKNPDGTLESACVHGPDDARAFLEAPPAPPKAPVTRER